LIFSFFSISDWSRFPSFLFKTQSLLPLFSFYSKYFIDFYIFSFLFLCNYLSNLSQDLLVCSRIIFYKLNKPEMAKPWWFCQDFVREKCCSFSPLIFLERCILVCFVFL
jgi:hypothetical protein